MSLHLHRAERADPLVDALADLLADPLGDPLTIDVVAVPTPGVERWLAQRLSGRLGATSGSSDGVCAAVEFPTVSALLNGALSTSGDWRDRSDDPWRPDRAAWFLLDVIDEARGEAFAALLWRYLSRGNDDSSLTATGRRWVTARRLADLFSRYAAQRPEMIRRWLAGDDLDAQGRALGPDRAWQAELWRRLRDRLDVPGPAERADAALERISANLAGTWPERISIFGVTRLDPLQLRVLAALSLQRDIHLWLTHPSPVLWRAVADHLTDHDVTIGPRTQDTTAALAHNRLLAHLGRDARELQVGLAVSGVSPTDHYHAGSLDDPPRTLLHHLHRGVADNRPFVPVTERPRWRPDDRSVTVHISHGPDRQVEVLRDLLVGLLADDPTLEPRDIVVMCPDVETFAPHIVAAFGLQAAADEPVGHPAHALRVRLADRSLRQLNPVLEVALRLLTLADSRMERDSLIDLAASAPVACRFAFREDELSRIRDLITASGVRWGLDPADRGRYAMSTFGQNTWAAGLDRLLLGVALDETDHHHLGTALPLDDVDSADVDLIGRFAEFFTRFTAFSRAARQPRPLLSWVSLLRSALSELTAVPRAENWQSAQAYALLAGIADRAGGATGELSLSEAAGVLADSVRGRPGRANFRTGTITVCTMMPMRSVPHRVICLLGVEDGVFPRRMRVDGDDLVAVEEWVGDRSESGEDRQLLLDAVLAAQERLIVIYAGRDARTGAERPAAVPIRELLDAVDEAAITADGAPVSSQVTTIHPLQPFDPENFQTRPSTSQNICPGTPFSFDREALRGAQAMLRPRRKERRLYGRDTLDAPVWDGSVELADLTRYFGHPARGLLRERARLYHINRDDEPDEIPIELDGLGRWTIGQRLLEAHLAGADVDRLAAAEWRRGQLPPRAFGHAVLAEVTARVRHLGAQAAPYRQGSAGREELAVARQGWSLSGTVLGLHGDDLVRVQYGRLSARHRLTAWLELLALTLSAPTRPWRAVLLGHRSSAVFGPLDQRWSELVLNDLIELWRSGLCEALPFAPRTSAHYAELHHSSGIVEGGRARAVEATWRRERDEVYACFFGPDLADLQAEPARPEERRGDRTETTRFGVLAQRVFLPLLLREVSL